MLKHNPHEYLRSIGYDPEKLSKLSQEAIRLFDQAEQIHLKYPDDANLKATAEKMGQLAIGHLQKDIKSITKTHADEQEEKEAHEKKQTHSRQLVEKAHAVLDELDVCRQRLREDRKKKIASGEIKPPVKRQLTEKLRSDLHQLAVLIPEHLRNNPEVIQKTERAILRFLHELKVIWGINKIKIIEDDLVEHFKKMLKNSKN